MNKDGTTEIIKKAVDEALDRKSSGEIPIDHEHRLNRHEEILADHSGRIKEAEGKLNDGNSRFIRLESKLEVVSDKLGELADAIKSAIRWVLGIAGTAAAGGILWAIAQSSGKVLP